MKWKLTLGAPGVVWIIVILFVYIVIKSPADGVFVLGLPARLISGIGNFFIGLIHSYGGPS
jgi:hypothetical protein